MKNPVSNSKLMNGIILPLYPYNYCNMSKKYLSLELSLLPQSIFCRCTADGSGRGRFAAAEEHGNAAMTSGSSAERHNYLNFYFQCLCFS